MEWGLLELLFQGSCCFLEIMATGTNLGAGVAGVKARRRVKQRRAAKELGEPEPSTAPVVIFLVLLFLGILLTIAVIAKWLRI